jgi:hypothetical protein
VRFDRPVYMKRLIAAAVLLAGRSGVPAAQTWKATSVRWPERIAVGMRQGDQLPPLTVEATKTGWITISFLSTNAGAGHTLPAMRMVTGARDLKHWITKVRPLLEALADSTRPKPDPFSVDLGNGAYRLQIAGSQGRTRRVSFGWTACGPGPAPNLVSTDELLDLLSLLDSATAVAGGNDGRPPTLSRPYYASEVSCPAVADTANKAPHLASNTPDLGTEFVVDTAGRVESESIRFLFGASEPIVRTVRAAVAQWRFHRAEIDGTPVRQIVQTVVSFAPQPTRRSRAARAVVVDATDDGWVHLIRAGNRGLFQEWFRPDSVDAWVTRVQSITREAARLPKDANLLVEQSTSLGSPAGVSLSAGFVRHANSLEMRAGLNACDGALSEGEAPVGDAAAFSDAAREARRHRNEPANLTSDIYTAHDVACSADLVWARYTLQGFNRVWRYPVGVYPESMRSANARADVLVSFVVDTTGAAELNTLEIMPGSDPRAVETLPATVAALRFRPATRAGHKVRQRLIQTIRFEPPPTCETLYASPACPRRYSDS